MAPIITLTADGIFSFLTPFIDPVAAEVIAGILAASLQFDVATYCAGDPPADPNLQPSDIADAINFTDTVNQAIAVQKIGTWFLSQYWYNICECTTGTQPTPPALSNPGPVSQNPGIPGANQTGPCWQQQMPWQLAARATGSNNETYQDLGVQLLPSGNSIQFLIDAGQGISVTAYAIPSGVSNLRLGMTTDQTNSNLTLQIEWVMLNASGSPTGQGLIATWQGSSLVQNQSLLSIPAPPSGAVYWALYAQNDNFSAFTGTCSVAFSCAPGTSLGQRACCPPDASAQQMLLQIIGILNSTRTDVTNLQTDITTINNNVNTLQTDVTNIDNSVTTLQTDVTNINNSVTTLQTDVTNLQTDVTNLQTTIDSETNTTITNVNTTVTATDTTVTTMNTTVNQLQAVLAPLGYTLGASHPGLTGDGSFGVTGLSGIFIQLTATPPGLGFDIGTPDYLFDLGWMSILDSNGFIDQARIHSMSQVWQSRLAGEATVIGFSLTPGVVATIHELLPKVG